MIVGMSNAVNLTDGLDGLAIMPAVMVSAALGLITLLQAIRNFPVPAIPYVAGAVELAVFCGALIEEVWGFAGLTLIPRKSLWEMDCFSYRCCIGIGRDYCSP